MTQTPPRSTLFPYTTLFRSADNWNATRESEFAGSIMQPLLEGLTRNGTMFRGLLFPGLMVTPEELRRSEEHTSELQSRVDLVCRLLLEKKNKLQQTTQESRQ